MNVGIKDLNGVEIQDGATIWDARGRAYTANMRGYTSNQTQTFNGWGTVDTDRRFSVDPLAERNLVRHLKDGDNFVWGDKRNDTKVKVIGGDKVYPQHSSVIKVTV